MRHFRGVAVGALAALLLVAGVSCGAEEDKASSEPATVDLVINVEAEKGTSTFTPDSCFQTTISANQTLALRDPDGTVVASNQVPYDRICRWTVTLEDVPVGPVLSLENVTKRSGTLITLNRAQIEDGTVDLYINGLGQTSVVG